MQIPPREGRAESRLQARPGWGGTTAPNPLGTEVFAPPGRVLTHPSPPSPRGEGLRRRLKEDAVDYATVSGWTWWPSRTTWALGSPASTGPARRRTSGGTASAVSASRASARLALRWSGEPRRRIETVR